LLPGGLLAAAMATSNDVCVPALTFASR
jgi:hypothetical protein